jgi:hypothetical protein
MKSGRSKKTMDRSLQNLSFLNKILPLPLDVCLPTVLIVFISTVIAEQKSGKWIPFGFAAVWGIYVLYHNLVSTFPTRGAPRSEWLFLLCRLAFASLYILFIVLFILMVFKP